MVGKNHLKFKVRQDAVVMDAIGFNMGDYLNVIETNNRVIDCCYILEENKWNLTQTAKQIDLRYETLIRKIKKLGLKS